MLKFFIVNFVPIMGSAVGPRVLAALWYSPLLFASIAKRGEPEDAKAPEEAKAVDKRWALRMLLTFAADISISLVLLHVILLNGMYGVKSGANLGFVVGLGLVAAPMLATYIHEKRSLRLFMANSTYWILALTISSAFMARRIL